MLLNGTVTMAVESRPCSVTVVVLKYTKELLKVSNAMMFHSYLTPSPPLDNI